MSAVYKNPRPTLVIEMSGSKSLGNCYSATYFKITSTKRLSQKAIEHLWKGGFIGYGQEFHIKSKCNGDETCAGTDTVKCVDSETGEPAINPYTGMLYGEHTFPYFVYDIDVRCDSGD